MLERIVSKFFPQKEVKRKPEQKTTLHDTENFAVISGSANTPLVDEVIKRLGIDKIESSVEEFSDRELNVKIAKCVRGKHVYIIQSGQPDPNTRVMEAALMCDAARRSSSGERTVIFTYLPYSRKDRKDEPRVPISAAVVANIMTKVGGADRIVTFDLHAEQEQGFIDEPWDNLYTSSVFVPRIHQYQKSGELSHDLVVASPDAGGLKRANTYFDLLDAVGIGWTAKERSANGPKILAVSGDVAGKDVLIVDDIIGEAASLKKSSKAFEERGAKTIFAAIPHAVLSGDAMDNVDESAIDKWVITNSINHPELRGDSRFDIVSIAPLVADTIKSIEQNRSLEKLILKKEDLTTPC